MIVVVEGPDGAGKSTLVDYLVNEYKLEKIHSNNKTENTLQYHLDLLKDNRVLDRANLGEIVYPLVYARQPKMTWSEQMEFMSECVKRDVIYIIFYASNFKDLEERLFKRGDTEEVLENAKYINDIFSKLARDLENEFPNVYALDISTIKNQINAFDNILKGD